LDWEITQEVDTGDTARFVLDDADNIFSDYAKQISLERASVRFFVRPNNPFGGNGFHNLWQGYISTWTWNRNEGTFIIDCEGGLHGLKRSMPRRSGATVCPWQFNDGVECPYDAHGSGGDPDTCDKGLDTANGCIAHGMNNYFGGVNPKPQTVSGKLNDTGFLGAFRKSYTSTSTPIKSIQSEVIPLVYGVGRQIVPATIFETRDESEFFVAAGIVSEGQIREIGQVLLDGQTMHPGYAPIIAYGTIGQNIGTHIDSAFRSSHTCFVSVRRVDDVGFKNPNEPHSILVEVKNGLYGTSIWWWTGPFSNAGDFPTNCPPMIALNFVLRALGIHHGYNPDLLKDTIVEIDRMIQCQAYCEALVPSLTGGSNEKRFEFRGVVKDLKPAIEHLRDILACAPIDLVYTVGKVAFKIRKDDITTPPSTQISFEHLENIIQGSFVSARREPRFNELKILYSDIALDFQENSITVYDEEAQKRSGFLYNSSSHQGDKKPHVKQAQMNAIGLFNKSQVLRLGTQLLLEEMGGKTEQEQLDSRDVSLVTPLIGIAVEISDVSPVIHPELPGGMQYVRWKRWKLNSNWEVELSGSTVTASMYGSDPLQSPGDNPNPETVPGIPGGSQGSGPGINEPEELTPPVLYLISESYSTGIVGVTCGEPPDTALTPAPPPTPTAPPQSDPTNPAPSGDPPEEDEDTPVPPPVIVLPPVSNPTGTHKWYISGTGSDSNTGDAPDKPFLTLGKALSKVVAGDALLYRGGNYAHQFSNNFYTIPVGNSWSQPIIIAPYNNEPVTIRSVGLGQSRIQYLIFQQLKIDAADVVNESVWLGYGTHHCRFTHCEIMRASHQGILIPHTGDHHHEFLYCNIHHNGIAGRAYQNGYHTHGVYCAGSDNLLDHCVVHDNWAVGVQVYNGYGGSDRPNRCVVRFCEVYRNGVNMPASYTSFGIGLDVGDDLVCHNNLVYSNRGGIGSLWRSPLRGLIAYNTIFGNGAVGGLHIGVTPQNWTIRNNISYGNSGGNYKNDGSPGLTQTNNEFAQNPLFVNSAAIDFHLQAGSPCLNAGIAIAGLTVDRDGVARHASTPDIGCYERV